MTIVGLTFTKIHAERGVGDRGQIKISNTVNIEDVVESNISLGMQSQSGLKFSFVYKSSYEPTFGSIELYGSLIYLDEPKKVKEILDGWKKKKILSPELMRETINAILARCNIQAIFLSREINLPPPVPLPKVTVETKPKGK